MTLSMYIVVAETGTNAINDRVDSFDDTYKYNDNTFLIRTTESIDYINEKLGFSENSDETTGVVFRLNSAFSGYTHEELWDWIYKKESKVA